MKKVLMLIMIATLILSFGCTKDDDVDAFAEMTDYIVESGIDLPALLTDWYKPAATLHDSPDDYYVIDIRTAADYTAGHIPGAVNATFDDILTAAEDAPSTKRIAVTCYSGQTAAHAVMALRLSGYTDAVSLLWGMSGWSSENDSWSGACASIGVGNANWTDGDVAADVEYDYPEIDTDLEDGAEILAERVDAMIAAGFKGIPSADVLANPENYFINNFWEQTDWDLYGGISGAHRINPMTIAAGELANLNPDETIVTYCWTGQTSSMITAFLTTLGYDALSLKNGANSMIYSELQAHKWDATTIVDYDKE